MIHPHRLAISLVEQFKNHTFLVALGLTLGLQQGPAQAATEFPTADFVKTAGSFSEKLMVQLKKCPSPAQMSQCICDAKGTVQEELNSLRKTIDSYPDPGLKKTELEIVAAGKSEKVTLEKFAERFKKMETLMQTCGTGKTADALKERFDSFQAKTRQTEAKTTLAHLYTLQKAYFEQNQVYASLPETGRGKGCQEKGGELEGFTLTDCGNSRYSYTIQLGEDKKTFIIMAASGKGKENKITPGCRFADIWTIDHQKEVLNVQSSYEKCKEPIAH